MPFEHMTLDALFAIKFAVGWIVGCWLLACLVAGGKRRR